MKECDERNSLISGELHLIYIYWENFCLEGLLGSIKQVLLPVILLRLLTKSVFRLQALKYIHCTKS